MFTLPSGLTQHPNTEGNLKIWQKTMKTHLLRYLHSIGLLGEVPAKEPAPRKVLARSVCFLHDEADNPNAFLLYADGYACMTHQCHQNRTFGLNLEGLIRHMVFRVTQEVMPWWKAWDYARSNKARLKKLVGESARHVTTKSSEHKPVEWTLKDLASSLSTPDAYYLKRGYRPETLEHFGVGTCVRPLPDGKNLPGWSIIPIPDLPNQPLCGYTARNPRWHDGSPYPKWYHAVSRRNCLFNSYAASKKLWPLIFCEGPGCVMRFHEAGFPGGIATLGTTLTSGQYYKFLSIYYNQRVLIAADADEPGQKFAEEL